MLFGCGVAVRVFFWVVIGGVCCGYLLLASDMVTGCCIVATSVVFVL